MTSQIHSIPDLIRDVVPRFNEAIRSQLPRAQCLAIERLFVIGCGDSHHAALATEWAFEALAGVPAEPMTSLQFARYAVRYVPRGSAVIGISVSGGVSRTAEGLRLASQAGAMTLALTAAPASLVATSARQALVLAAPPFAEPAGIVTPGVRSFAVNQIALLLIAVHLGEVRGRVSADDATTIRRELLGLAQAADWTIEKTEPAARVLAQDWADAREFVFAGAGPNFAAALFSAAKVLEATGDSALGQDTEEWAHLQYFARVPDTPTFIVSAGGRDLSRAIEIVVAAKTIGRRLATVTPPSIGGLSEAGTRTLPFADGVREMFTPVISPIPCALFAAHRSDLIGEPFFRAFRGGRSIEGGGGISRIRTSEMWDMIK